MDSLLAILIFLPKEDIQQDSRGGARRGGRRGGERGSDMGAGGVDRGRAGARFGNERNERTKGENLRQGRNGVVDVGCDVDAIAHAHVGGECRSTNCHVVAPCTLVDRWQLSMVDATVAVAYCTCHAVHPVPR